MLNKAFAGPDLCVLYVEEAYKMSDCCLQGNMTSFTQNLFRSENGGAVWYFFA